MTRIPYLMLKSFKIPPGVYKHNKQLFDEISFSFSFLFRFIFVLFLNENALQTLFFIYKGSLDRRIAFNIIID